MNFWKRERASPYAALEPALEPSRLGFPGDLRESPVNESPRGTANPEEVVPGTCPDYSLSWRRSAFWQRIVAGPIVLVVLVCGFGVILARYIAKSDIGRFARLQAPARESPRAGQTEINNERVASMGLAVDLDGKAVLYPEEVAALVGHDGSFRTDLSLDQLAAALRIDPRTISKTGSPDEINPGAVLFKVMIGTLTERSKALRREQRTTKRRESRPTDMLVDEFVKEKISFTLDALKQPDGDQKTILTAISRSARELMVQPGETARAIVTSREAIESGSVEFWPGYLPLEASSIRPDAQGP